jgi:K+-transporting ATPase ATPase C chain
MWSQIMPGLRIKLFFTLLLGVIYPLLITGVCQGVFPHQANGSLRTAGGRLAGSDLIGQSFSKPEYFQPRPSSSGSGYDATASSGSNLGPTSAKFIYGSTKAGTNGEAVDFDGISLRLLHYCLDNGLPYQSSIPLEQFRDSNGAWNDVKLIKAFNDPKAPLVFVAKTPVPADAVTGSGSGLDPHISPANAAIQAARVAKARSADPRAVRQLAASLTEAPGLGFLGEPRVNVLQLNLALDERFPLRH